MRVSACQCVRGVCWGAWLGVVVLVVVGGGGGLWHRNHTACPHLVVRAGGVGVEGELEWDPGGWGWGVEGGGVVDGETEV